MKESGDDNVKITSGAVVAAGVIGLGGYLLYKWLSTEKTGGYRNNLDDADARTDKWLMSGIKTAADLKDIVESQGAQLQETITDEGYLLTHDMAGFPIMSRMYIQDSIYLSDEIKNVALFSKIAARFAKTNNYLHITVFRLPDVATEDYEYWVIFFSNEKKFSKDPSFLTNMGHSWTTNSDWQSRFKNRSLYNQVTLTLKDWLTTQGEDLEAWYEGEEIKRFYERAKSTYAEQIKNELRREFPYLTGGQLNQMALDHAQAWLNPGSVDYYMMINHSRNSMFGQSLKKLREKQLLGASTQVYYGERLPGNKNMNAVEVTMN